MSLLNFAIGFSCAASKRTLSCEQRNGHLYITKGSFMIQKRPALLLFILTLSPLAGFGQTVALNAGNPVVHLVIQAGVVAHVACSSQPQLMMQGLPSFLSAATYSQQSNTLTIDAHQNGGAIHSPTLITAQIQLNSKVQSLKVERGGFVTMDSCVVDPNNLSLELRQGAHVDINGYTKNLSVNASMGGFLNKEGHHVIKTDQAFLSCTQGCVVKIGQAQTISGQVMFGGQVYIPSNAQRMGLNQGMGGNVYFN